MSMIFQKIALVGVGLIGSSICQAARRKKLVNHISVATRREKTLEEARSISIADEYFLSASEAVKDADLVILCAPVGAFEAIMKEIGPHLKAGAILSDVGSVKGHVDKVVGPLVPAGVHFVPGHPMAGTEHSGPLAGFASLFEGRWCILTPRDDVERDAVQKLVSFWQGLGSEVELMDAAHHDLVVAITSHVPHLVAYNIVGTADDMEAVSKSEVIKFSAGGFRDFTRIAASDPVMWRDVFLTNREAVLEMLGRFLEDLSVLQRAVRVGDGDALEELFTRTREIRRSIIDAGQETDVVDFGRDHKRTEK
ncbi:MAG TPA: prephenate/arogenate dehydrogenase family protein [Devosia sp.]|nr:prephenate/arogenate dehydrogenase family protein [Devosia sp.]